MKKCRPTEVPALVIRIAINCTEGYSYNWVAYVVKEFLEDARNEEEKGRAFHYSWLIVLIALVGWKEPTETQFAVVPAHMPGAARYASLWVSQDKTHQQMTKYVFSFYMMSISYEIINTPWLSHELFSQYDGAVNFRADMHHIFIQDCADKKHQWFKLPYVVTKDDILTVV